jgi:O-antigen/teichoic acid export membrane protein
MSQLIMMFLLPFSSRHYAARNIPVLSATAEKAICFSTVILLPMAFVMIAFPGEILHLLYGQRYADGAPIVRILGFVAFVVPWTAVSSSFIGGIGRVKEALFFGIGLVVVSGIVYPVCIKVFQTAGAALAFVAVSTLFGVSVTVYVQRFVPFSVRETFLRVRDIRTFARGQWHDFIDRF